MFGLDPVKDIVAATGDGASVMVRFGNITEFEYIQCLNHGIHLSVVEVLYKKKPQEEIMEAGNSSSSSSHEDTDEESDCEPNEVCPYVLQGDFEATIVKMRKIVKMLGTYR